MTVRAEALRAEGVLFRTPAELRRDTPAEPEWVMNGYLARRWLTIAGGKPKVGKSTVFFALAEAVASGSGTFLGRAIASGPVVIVTEEGSTTALAKLPDLDNIRVLTREGAWPKPSWPELVDAAVAGTARVEAVLLLIDSWAFWASLPADAEKDAGAAQAALAPLIEAAAAGSAVGLIHHQRKSGGEGGDALRGSGAIAANADALMEIERLDDEDAPPRQRRLVAISRWPDTPPLMVFDYDPALGGWRVVGEGEGRADADRVAWRDRILGALPTGEPGATNDDLSDALGADKRKWLPELTKLVKAGRVQSVGRGVRGDPKRYWRALADSVQGFRPEPRTERDGNAPDDPNRIPSHPLGGTESIRSANGKPFRTPSANGNETRSDVAAQADVDAYVARFRAREAAERKRREAV